MAANRPSSGHRFRRVAPSRRSAGSRTRPLDGECLCLLRRMSGRLKGLDQSPSAPLARSDITCLCSRAGVTQLAECLLPKQNVAGSNPVSRSTLPYSTYHRGFVEAASLLSTEWHQAELLPEREPVWDEPRFDDAAVLEAIDPDPQNAIL
jgi:hypothetical protein